MSVLLSFFFFFIIVTQIYLVFGLLFRPNKQSGDATLSSGDFQSPFLINFIDQKKKKKKLTELLQLA